MAATMRINRRTGAGGSPADTNVTGAGYKLSVDDANNGTTPVQIPQAGQNVNATVPASLILECTAQTGSTISNKRISYTGPAMPSGMMLYCNTESTASLVTSATYAQKTSAPPGQTTSVSATALGTANYVRIGNGAPDVTTQYDSSSAVVSAIGMVGKYVLVVLAVDATATDTGVALTLPTLVLTYDEQ